MVTSSSALVGCMPIVLSKSSLGNQKLIPYNGQEEREAGGLVFVSIIAKPYHMHKSTQSTAKEYVVLITGFTIRTQNAQIKGWSVTIVHN